MKERHRKWRRGNEPRHVRVYHVMMHTEAWRSLSGNAKALYVQISARYGGPGSNNGRISFSVREAAEALHVGKDAAEKAFANLIDRGFIVIAKKGAFRRKDRHATEYLLTEFSSDINDAIATRDYQRWSPKIQNAVPKAGPSVPEAGPSGPYNRTEAA
jgi:predicted transcriptional regulator